MQRGSATYKYRQFEIEITIEVGAKQLSWPAPEAATDDSGLGCNREYFDIRRLPWSEAEDVYGAESALIARIEAAEDPDEEYAAIEDESAEEPDGIYGLDIGVASTVIALSAARCVPFSSCNAGAFGGRHYECYPVVAFFARPEMVDILLECAQKSDVGLINYDTGELVVYARDIRHMRAFAVALMEKRSAFRSLRLSRQKTAKAAVTRQLKLL